MTIELFFILLFRGASLALLVLACITVTVRGVTGKLWYMSNLDFLCLLFACVMYFSFIHADAVLMGTGPTPSNAEAETLKPKSPALPEKP